MLARKLACWVAATAVPFSQVDGLIKGRFPVYFAGALRGAKLAALLAIFARASAPDGAWAAVSVVSRRCARPRVGWLRWGLKEKKDEICPGWHELCTKIMIVA